MLAAWKLRYKRAYNLRQLAHQVSDGASQFGSANLSIRTRPSAPQHSNVRFANQPPSAGEHIKYVKIEGYLDNLAHAATKKKAVLQKLFAVVALLTTTNATIVEEIKALTADNKYPGRLARSATTVQPGKGKENDHWTKANPGHSIVYGYCHMHGFCVGKYHDSGL